MPKIASVLKDEIFRLARRVLRTETEKLKKASTHYRSEIAALKRRIQTLERQASRRIRTAVADAPGDGEAPRRPRFSGKGLHAHRQRLGLSAAAMGKLLGVTGQTIYNWEAGTTRPRGEQLATLAKVRSIGRREAAARLEAVQAQ